MKELVIIGGIVLGVLGLLPVIVSMFLRDVEAGTIRLVSWLQGSTITYRGPGKTFFERHNRHQRLAVGSKVLSPNRC